MALAGMKASVPVAVLALALSGLFGVPAGAAPPSDGWRIRLDASQTGLVDRGRVTLGAGAAASNGFDAFDDPHPPVFPSRFLDLFTSHLQTVQGTSSDLRLE